MYESIPGFGETPFGNVLAVNNKEETGRSLKRDPKTSVTLEAGKHSYTPGPALGSRPAPLPLLAAGTPPPFLTHLLPGASSSFLD